MEHFQKLVNILLRQVPKCRLLCHCTNTVLNEWNKYLAKKKKKTRNKNRISYWYTRYFILKMLAIVMMVTCVSWAGIRFPFSFLITCYIGLVWMRILVVINNNPMWIALNAEHMRNINERHSANLYSFRLYHRR